MRWNAVGFCVLATGLLLLAGRGQAESIRLDAATEGQLVNLVPAYVLELPATVNDVLVADTADATLWRFEVADGRMIERDQRYMSIGVNGVGKSKAWDRRTPLGVYFITERLDTSRMHAKYGVAAFPLDYPNAWDRHLERTGDGIWLHGVDRNSPERPALDTDGCLSLPNDELLKIASHLEPQVTPVIVAREIRMAQPDELEQTRLAFRIALDMWRQSLEQGDLLAYLSLYSEDFRYRDWNKTEWSTYRLGVFEAREFAAVALDDVLLLADPEEPDLYLSRFTQVLTTNDGEVRTTKRLYWKRTADEVWKIISEDSG